MDLVVSQELEIYGSHGMPARDYPAMLALIEDGTLRPADLVGQVIGLDEAGAALAAMDHTSTGGMTVVSIDAVHGREG
jgi:alcohol dehydrogenase